MSVFICGLNLSQIMFSTQFIALTLTSVFPHLNILERRLDALLDLPQKTGLIIN